MPRPARRATGGAGAAAGTTGSAGTGGGPSSCVGIKPTDPTPAYRRDPLSPVNGDMTITQDGTTIDGKDIYGFLIIAASNVRVTRSVVRGHATPYAQNTGVIRIDSGTNILIEDVEVAVVAPSATVDGIWGANFVGRRLNIHGGVDGLKAGSNTRLECSYIHDQAYFASDPNQGGGPTHNDAIQILEGTGIHIVGNQLIAEKDQNAAVQVTQDFGAVVGLHLESNWAERRRLHVQHLAQGRDVVDRRVRDRKPIRAQFVLQLRDPQEHADHAGAHRQRVGRHRRDRAGPDARLAAKKSRRRLTRPMARRPQR